MNIETLAATLFAALSRGTGHKLINIKDIRVQCVANLLMLHQEPRVGNVTSLHVLLGRPQSPVMENGNATPPMRWFTCSFSLRNSNYGGSMCAMAKRSRPKQQIAWSDFEIDTKRGLEALGYSVSRDLLLHGNQVDLYAERHEPFITHRLLIECKDFAVPIGIDHVRNLAARVDAVSKREAPVYGMLVAKGSFTATARSLAQSLNITLVTLTDLLIASFDPAPIIGHVMTSFEQGDLRKKYVDLNCQVTETRGSTIYKPAEKFFDSFFESTRRPGLALLGNFGSGKTSLCKHYSYLLAHRFGKGASTALPIYVDLKDLRTFGNLENDLFAYIRSIYSVKATLSGFVLWLHHKANLLILDGFDEMASRMDKQQINKELSALTQFCAIFHCKIILACRTHFFRTNVDERALGNMLRLYLRDWGSNELCAYVAKSLPQQSEAILKTIHETYNLEELARTPLFLSMITATLPVMTGRVNKARLYQTYTDRWIQEQSYRSRLSPEDKEQFMEELAFEMFCRGAQPRIHHSDLPLRIKQIFQVQDWESVTALDADIRTCSFLIRDTDGEGLYYFAHKSYMEFFVGHKFARELKEGRLENSGKEHISIEVAGFVADYFEEDYEVLVRIMIGGPNPILRANAVRALGLVTFNAGLLKSLELCIETEKEQSVLRCAVDALTALKRAEATAVVVRMASSDSEISIYSLGSLAGLMDNREVVTLCRSILADSRDSGRICAVLQNVAVGSGRDLQADIVGFCRLGWWRDDAQVVAALVRVIQGSEDLDLALMLGRLESASTSEAISTLIRQAKAELQLRFRPKIIRDATMHKDDGLDYGPNAARLHKKYGLLLEDDYLRQVLENLYAKVKIRGMKPRRSLGATAGR